jgi:hypothetical protein
MSIIMAGQVRTSETGLDPCSADHIHPDVRALLDHIAVELAEEYVRLMETAAAAQARAGSPDESEYSEEGFEP